MLIIVTALVYSVSKQLTASQQWQAAKREYQLTPESVIGDDLSWQRAWSPQGPSIPQGDASALVVDRSMQQPRVSYQHKSSDKNEKLFAKILSMKERLYGSNSEISISGPRDLATAAVEINRYCQQPTTYNVCKLFAMFAVSMSPVICVNSVPDLCMHVQRHHMAQRDTSICTFA